MASSAPLGSERTLARVERQPGSLFLMLPTEMILQILEYLLKHPYSLGAVPQTCRQLRWLCRSIGRKGATIDFADLKLDGGRVDHQMHETYNPGVVPGSNGDWDEEWENDVPFLDKVWPTMMMRAMTSIARQYPRVTWVDPKRDGDFLTMAVYSGMLNTVERSLKMIADAAAKRSLAAIAADGAADDDDGLVRVDDGLAHDGDGTRLLHIACKGGSVQVVEALLDFGADVDVQDMFDDAPLHYAAPHNKADVCRVLLTRGANPDATNSDGETPLMKIAISGEALDAATVLLEAGADLELMDVRHNTALDLATDSCDVDMVRFLLGRGAIASEQTRHAARGLRGREYLMRRVPDQVADIINLVGA
jgi:hypothetical protein